jgi:hypothetical protein
MTILRTDGEPLATGVELSEAMLKVVLDDGRELSVPIEWFPRLRDATAKQRGNWRLIGRGEGIHWPDIDEDISVAGLLRGRVAKRPRDRAA